MLTNRNLKLSSSPFPSPLQSPLSPSSSSLNTNNTNGTFTESSKASLLNLASQTSPRFYPNAALLAVSQPNAIHELLNSQFNYTNLMMNNPMWLNSMALAAAAATAKSANYNHPAAGVVSPAADMAFSQYITSAANYMSPQSSHSSGSSPQLKANKPTGACHVDASRSSPTSRDG